jgi:hypothetical protein
VASQHGNSGWRRIGDILVEDGLITTFQLRIALSEQSRAGTRLGEILVARGWVSAADLVNALAKQRGIRLSLSAPGGEPSPSPLKAPGTAFALGRLLVERGRISEEQLEQALEHQHRTGLRLGEILRSSGAVSARELAEALAEQQGKAADQMVWSRALADSVNRTLANDASEQNPPDSWFELHELEHETDTELYSSPRFLDIAEVALAVLSEWTPERLEIINTDGSHREPCWQYPMVDPTPETLPS